MKLCYLDDGLTTVGAAPSNEVKLGLKFGQNSLVSVTLVDIHKFFAFTAIHFVPKLFLYGVLPPLD